MQKTVLPCSQAVGRKIPSLKVYELMFVVGAKNICCFWCSKRKFLDEFMLQMTLGEVESTSNSSFLQSLNLFREELDQWMCLELSTGRFYIESREVNILHINSWRTKWDKCLLSQIWVKMGMCWCWLALFVGSSPVSPQKEQLLCCAHAVGKPLS